MAHAADGILTLLQHGSEGVGHFRSRVGWVLCPECLCILVE